MSSKTRWKTNCDRGTADKILSVLDTPGMDLARGPISFWRTHGSAVLRWKVWRQRCALLSGDQIRRVLSRELKASIHRRGESDDHWRNVVGDEGGCCPGPDYRGRPQQPSPRLRGRHGAVMVTLP